MKKPAVRDMIFIGLGILLLGLVLSVGLFVRLQSTSAVKRMVSALSDGKYQLEANKIRVDPLRMVVRATGLNITPVHPDQANGNFYLHVDTMSLKLSHVLSLIFQRKLSVDHFRMVNPSLVMKVNDKDTTVREKQLIPLHIQVSRMQEVFFRVLESLQVNSFSLVNGNGTYYPDFNGSGQKYFLNHINLDINDLNLVKRISEWDKENRVGIRFELIKPDIEYPDSTININLDNLLWDTKTHQFDLTGLGFHKNLGEENDSSGFRLEGIELDSLNWNSLLTQGKVELGRLQATKGFFSTDNFSLKKNKDSTVTVKPTGNLLDVIGPILVKELAIYEIEFIGNTHTRRGKETLQVKGDQLLVKNLVVDKKMQQRVQLDELQLKVRAFLDTDSNRTFQSGFNELSIVGNDLFLKDYFLHSLKPTRYGKNKIDVKSLSLVGIDIEELISGKLKAKELVLTDPTVYVNLPGRKKTRKTFSWEKFQKKLSEKMDIGRLRIENANMYVNNEGEKTPFISTQSFSAIISSHNAINSEKLEDIFDGQNSFNMPQLAIRLPNMWVDCRNARYAHKSFYAENAKGRSRDGNIRFNIRDFSASDINTQALVNGTDSTLLRLLRIGGGELYVKLGEAKKKNDSASVVRRSAIVRTIYGGKFLINLEGAGFQFRTTTDSLQLTRLVQQKDRWSWDSLFLSGDNLHLNIKGIQANTAKYLISNHQPTTVQQARLSINKPAMTASMLVPSLQFSLSLQNSKDIIPSLEKIVLRQPQIDLVLRSKTTETEKPAASAKPLSLPLIHLVDPVVKVSRETEWEKKEIATVNGGDIRVHRLNVQQQVVSTDRLELDLRQVVSDQEKFKVRLPSLLVSTGPLQLRPHEPVVTQLEKLQLKEGSFDIDDGRKNISLHNINAQLEKSFRLNTSKDSLKRLLSSLPHLQLSTGRLLYQKADRTVLAGGLVVSSAEKRIRFDSLQWTSSLTRDSFFRASGVQKDFMQLHTGAGEINNYEMIPLLFDTAWKIGKLTVSNMRLLVERDKRFPTDTVSYRPLLAGSLVKIPLMVNADHIVLNNAHIRYNEINDKNGHEGSIWFSHLNANIRYARNYDIGPTDSLRITAQTRLMDQGDLRLNFSESYMDSLKGFYLLARVGAMPFEALAPLLTPMFGVQFDSGQLDTLSLRVKGNDYLAYGKMDMHYNHLRMTLLKEERKRKFLSWAANLFVRNKKGKTGLVFRERMRNKSTFNYWGKIAVSGLMTTMGIKGNKKVEKKYRREMNNLHLPPSLLED